MKKIFLGSPIRNPRDGDYVEIIASALIDAGFSVFVPANAIGILDKGAEDVGQLQLNFDEINRCDIAIFLIEREGTGTGIELGYLYCLKERGESEAKLFGICRPEYKEGIDLMARYCLGREGQLVHSVGRLVEILQES